MVEDRLVGMKSRGVYENPAGAIIYYGHNDLENLCLDRATQSFKQQVPSVIPSWFTMACGSARCVRLWMLSLTKLKNRYRYCSHETL